MSSKTTITAKKEETTPALVPKLRFPEFRGAEGWGKAALGGLMEITSSKRVHESDWAAVGVPFYRAREIVALNNGEPITPLFISEELYRENANKSGEIVPGDLLVSGVGSIGIPYLVKPNDRFYFKDGNIIWLKNRGTKLQGQFLLTLYGTLFVQSQIKTMAGVGTVGTYTIDNANKTVVVFPVDDAEQQKIASCLSSVDELMAAQARKVDALKTHKKGLMQQLFPREGETQPRLRFPEFRNAGEWEEDSMQDVFVFRQGLQVAVENQFLDNEEDRERFIRIIDITQTNEPPRYITVTKGANIVSSEDLFMIRYGTPGVVAIGYEGVIANNLFQLIFKNAKNHSSFFWHHYLQTKYEEISGLSGSSSMPAISFKTLNHVEVKYPPLAEQQRIAACLTSLDSLITAETRKIEALKTHKKGLMQQLFPSPEELAE